MTPELLVLVLAGLLQGLQFVLYAVPANLDLGLRKTLGPRDPQGPEAPLERQVSVLTGRLGRALSNHFEGLILFTIAVLVVTLSNQSTPFTATCAYAYLVARLLYIPAYAFGWRPWRSAIWAVGFFATNAMIVASLI